MTVAGPAAGHAVVLGGGMAGLLAARVLSDVFHRVTVVERDPVPSGASPRRGVPQGRQINGLESGGVSLLDDMLPGLIDQLVAAGASRIGDLADMHYRVDGLLMTRRPTPIHPFLLVTRPFLEDTVRRRVLALPGVTLRDKVEVTGLLHRTIPSGQQVTGVRLTPAGGWPAGSGSAEDVEAELVVDATGRGSRTPVWLSELGYPRPAEERIPVRITYATRLLRLPSSAGPPPFLIEGTAVPGQAGISLFHCEQGRTLFSVNGPRDAFPSPVTGEWMLQVAAERLPADALAAVRAASAADDAGPVAAYQVPASVRRRYDRLTRFPRGLLVLGDALCAFNPVYGQGVSVAAGQAAALRSTLLSVPSVAALADADLAAPFFAAAQVPTAAAWRLASGPDLAHVGGAPGRERLAAWVTGKVLSQAFRAAQRDAEVARLLTGVTGLSEHRSVLLRPRVLGPLAVSAARLALHRLAGLSSAR